MEWNPELPKIQENINRRNKIDKAVDAAVLTPGTLVVGDTIGTLGAGVIPTGLSKEPIQPMTKATRKALNKAISHNKIDPDIRVISGRKALKEKGPVPAAMADLDLKTLDKNLDKAKTLKDVKKIKFLRNKKISLPQGANTEAALHELGHLKHYGSPARMMVSSTAKQLGKPVGAAAAVAGMLHEDTAKYVPVVAPAIGYGSTVAQELGANTFAVKEMARQKGFKAGLKALKKVTPYMATYLAAPLAVGGALYGLKRKIHDS